MSFVIRDLFIEGHGDLATSLSNKAPGWTETTQSTVSVSGFATSATGSLRRRQSGDIALLSVSDLVFTPTVGGQPLVLQLPPLPDHAPISQTIPVFVDTGSQVITVQCTVEEDNTLVMSSTPLIAYINVSLKIKAFIVVMLLHTMNS